MKAARFGHNVTSKFNCGSKKLMLPPVLHPKMPNLKMFINNEWVDSVKPGNFYTPVNPTTGKPITEVQSACKEDVDRAVEAAKQALKHNSPWRQMDASMRCKLLHKLADLMERDASYLASLETLEVGKVYRSVLVSDIYFTADQLRHTAGWADKISGEVLPIDGEFLFYSKYQPVGVCGLISAWNFPTLMNATKISYSTVGGNVCILKPSQHASLTTLHLAELAKEAGFPPGVINVVPGSSEIGQMLCSHPEVDSISFTGSTKSGQDVYKRGSENIKKLVLQLGGKSPLVVFDDADLNDAVQTAHTAIFHNSGQCCCSASRTYVQESIFEEFVKRSIEMTKRRKIGNPFDEKTMHGPQANENHLNSIMNMIEIGKKEGATVKQGGNRCSGEGFFMEPTIFTDVKEEMIISREEIFGPVQLISPFKTMDEVLEKANNTQYGLASSIFTKDIDKINTFTQCIEAGNVWVNCYFGISSQAPFGGYKMSGLNREGGLSSVKAFLEEKAIQIKSPLKIA